MTSAFVFRGHSLRLCGAGDGRCELCAARVQPQLYFLPGLAKQHYRCELCSVQLHTGCLSAESAAGAARSPPLHSCPVQLVASGQLRLDWTGDSAQGTTTTTRDVGGQRDQDAQQQQQCGECGRSSEGSNGRQCHFCRRRHCRLCHWGDRTVVPWHLLATGSPEPLPVCRRALGLLSAFRHRAALDLHSQSAAAGFLRRHDSPNSALRTVVEARRQLLLRLGPCRQCPALRDTIADAVVNSHRHLHASSASEFTLHELQCVASGNCKQLLAEIDAVVQFVQRHAAACADCTPRLCPVCLDADRRLRRHSDSSWYCRDCHSVYHKTCRCRIRGCRVCQCQAEVRRSNQLIGGPISYDPQLLRLYEPGGSFEEQRELLQRLLRVTPSSELHLSNYGLFRLSNRQRKQPIISSSSSVEDSTSSPFGSGQSPFWSG